MLNADESIALCKTAASPDAAVMHEAIKIIITSFTGMWNVGISCANGFKPGSIRTERICVAKAMLCGFNFTDGSGLFYKESQPKLI